MKELPAKKGEKSEDDEPRYPWEKLKEEEGEGWNQRRVTLGKPRVAFLLERKKT